MSDRSLTSGDGTLNGRKTRPDAVTERKKTNLFGPLSLYTCGDYGDDEEFSAAPVSFQVPVFAISSHCEDI